MVELRCWCNYNCSKFFANSLTLAILSKLREMNPITKGFHDSITLMDLAWWFISTTIFASTPIDRWPFAGESGKQGPQNGDPLKSAQNDINEFFRGSPCFRSPFSRLTLDNLENGDPKYGGRYTLIQNNQTVKVKC